MRQTSARLEAADPALLRYGGMGAMLAGGVFLLTLVYTFGFLASLGLTIEMLDDPAQLLPWIDAHTGAYLGLWGIYFASWLLLLPTPLALAEVTSRRDATPRIGAVAGIGGIVVGLVAVMVNMATAPVLAAAAVSIEPALSAGVLLLSELVASFGLHLRLLADLLIGIWLGLTGLTLTQLARWRGLGYVQIGVAMVTLVVVIVKPLGGGDWEPFLGLLLALIYLWLGVALLREAAVQGDGRTAA